MRRGLLVGALLGLWLAAPAANAFEVEPLRQSGPVTDRFNIAVLGDGYRTEDQLQLKTDAQGIIDYLFSVTPLAQYAGFFNVKLVHVISNQNGADNGTYGATRDTALGANFNCDNIERLLCIDDGQVAVAAAQDVPEYNFAIVIVNDPKYGGSGGSVCVASSNEQSFEVLAHEIGHSLAFLADEYSDEGNQPPCDALTDCEEANATLRTKRADIKWLDWIDSATPLPTPPTSEYASVVGLFEGARYTPTGVYRPQFDCKMRDLGADYCSVCTEQFVRSIWTAQNIKMIESTTPATPTVQSAACEPIALSVTSPPIAPSTYRYTWVVDGQPQPESDSHIELLPAVLGEGEHDVQVAVQDATNMVRSDPSSVLRDRFSWKVSQTKSDCPVSLGGAGGAGGVAGGGGGGGAAGTAGSMVAVGGAAGNDAGEVSGAAGAGSGAVATTAGGSDSSAEPGRNPPPRETSSCTCTLPGRSSADKAWGLVGAGGAAGVAAARCTTAPRRPRSAGG